MSRQTSWIHDIPEQVIAFYKAGHSLQQTADHFGNCSLHNVLYLLNKHGIPRRKRPEANRLVWTNEARQRASESRKGNKNALGKRWTVKHTVDRSYARGANNPMWKGGTTELGRAIRTSAMYRRWRTAVFQRDKYTCVLCEVERCVGNRVIIQADHIIPLSTLIHKHKIKSIEDARHCASLWDVANGRTLCKSCHKETNTYGRNLQGLT